MGNTRRKKIVMKIAIILLILGCTSCQRANRPPPTTTTTTYDDDYYDDDDSYDDDDEIVSLVKSYIDAGTCDMVSTGSTCGDNATSYYYEFEYEDQRVVIVNGIPDHDAENDQLVDNTNTRCERWQFMTVPIDPSKGTDATETSMGVIALAVTGGTFYNDLSNDDGAIALYNEGQSLDICAGHSSDNSQYHYHANILCDDDASDASVCKQVGWAKDGVPIYGYCNDSEGDKFASCYSVIDGYSEYEVEISPGTFQTAIDEAYYEYVDSDDCNLDKANGAIHPTTGQYSYFMTTTYPWVPKYYYGEDGEAEICSAI